MSTTTRAIDLNPKRPQRLPGRRWIANVAGAATLALILGGGAVVAQPAVAVTALPQFTHAGEVTVAADLDYAPTGEFIFPSVLHAGEYLENPLGEWYLYYAPHENPGGIAFMYADSLDGPWTEYASNPVVENVWQPHYAQVPHVSSPDVVWNEAEQEVFLYFHGDNGTTRYATSADGASFEYGGIAVTNAMGGTGITETSYARVSEHPDPASTYEWAMFYMDNTSANKRRIRLAESVDGKTWVVRPTPFLTPASGETNVSGANLFERDGQLYITYHASNGVSYARPVNAQLTTVGAKQVFYQASGVGEDVGRVAAPETAVENGKTYLFYESGGRLEATIRYAVAID